MQPNGKMAFGSNVDPLEEYTYTFMGKLHNSASIHTLGNMKANSFRWATNAQDEEHTAGVSHTGRVTIGDVRQNSLYLSVKNNVHVFGSKPQFSLGGTTTAQATILEEDSGQFKIFNQGDLIMQAGPGISGVDFAQVNAAGVEAGDLQVTNTATFGNNIDVNGGITTLGGTDTYVSNNLFISGNDAAKFELHTEASNVLIPGTSQRDFRVGVGTYGTGGLGLKVLTEDAGATKIANVSLYDISPIPGSPGEGNSLITIQWN